MNKKKLAPILADMHTHLNEKKLKPKDYWVGVKKRKLAVVAITEHSYCKPKEAYLKLKNTQPPGILLIPGMEAKTSAGDLLIYGENEELYNLPQLQQKNAPIKKVLQIIKENNLTASFAHPYGYKLDSVCVVLGESQTLKLIQEYGVGTEYYNGMLASANELMFGRSWVKKVYNLFNFVNTNRATHALRIYKTTDFPKKKMENLAEDAVNRVRNGMLFAENAPFVSVGSDAHYPRSIGSSIIELKRKPKDEKEFIQMIKNKETLWKGPNIYSKTPIDKVGKKEMVEGLAYLARKNVLKQRKIYIADKISKKIRLSKRIKTIKRISKKANLSKIRRRLPKIKLKKRINNLKKKVGFGK